MLVLGCVGTSLCWYQPVLVPTCVGTGLLVPVCVDYIVPQVNELLDGSKVWSAYKDQKHDLFITNNPTAGYLTGPVSGVAGYLTAGTGMSGASLSTPPPLKEPPEDVGGESND